jgi:hypothetical protein
MNKKAIGLLILIAGILIMVLGSVLSSTIWASMAYLMQVYVIIILGAVITLVGFILVRRWK